MEKVISMKIIIADAKTLKINAYPIQGQTPLFFKQALYLRQYMQQFNANDIHDLMNLSFKQSNIIYNYYQNNESYPALCLYDGVVYKQLHFHQYHDEEFQYLENYLLINSPIYGLCRYNDLIQFHRLEMKHKVNDLSLYDYWRDSIDNYLKDEDFILSLSTKEYEKMIHHPHLIQVDFVELSGEKIKRTAVYLKKARGKMLDYMIRHQITTIEQMKQIVVDDYHYSQEMSTDKKLVFVRNEKIKYTHL